METNTLPIQNKNQLTFLDKLRESDTENMYFVADKIQKEFNITAEKAQQVLANWRETFFDRLRNGEIK